MVVRNVAKLLRYLALFAYGFLIWLIIIVTALLPLDAKHRLPPDIPYRWEIYTTRKVTLAAVSLSLYVITFL
jgi:hypothetical protein